MDLRGGLELGVGGGKGRWEGIVVGPGSASIGKTNVFRYICRTMAKLIYTMGEVAQELGENASAVRYWSNYFEKFIKPSVTLRVTGCIIRRTLRP